MLWRQFGYIATIIYNFLKEKIKISLMKNIFSYAI